MTWMLKKLFGSKKFIMAMLGAIAVPTVGMLNQWLGWGMDAEQVSATLYPFIAYILGQGLADHGKEKAKAEQVAWDKDDVEPPVRYTKGRTRSQRS